MPEDQPWTDRQTLYLTFFVAAAVLLWEVLPLARLWIRPLSFVTLCVPLWLTLALADTQAAARRAYRILALRGSTLALAAALLLFLQGAR